MVKLQSASLDATFGALAHPIRRAILDRLSRGEALVTDLAAPFEITLPAVTKHLGVLERAGLVVRERDGRCRRCRLLARPMRDAALWIEEYRQFWDGGLDRLAQYLQQSGARTSRPWPSDHSPPSRSASHGSSRPPGRRSSTRGPGPKR